MDPFSLALLLLLVTAAWRVSYRGTPRRQFIRFGPTTPDEPSSSGRGRARRGQ